MTKADVLKWFVDVEGRPPTGQFISRSGFNAECVAWLLEIQSLVAAALPATHPLVRVVSEPLPTPSSDTVRQCEGHFMRVQGALQTARRLVETGRVEDFAIAVRAETETELLEAAAELLDEGHFVAAAVLIGGGLEVHLRALFARQPGAPLLKGSPSIEKYDNAINTARNDGHPTAYDAAKSKDVKAWAAKRNDAAHNPIAFNVSAPELKLMLEGVRIFVTTVR